MGSCYETLGIDSSATSSEIENKLDEIQDDLRQRVTHHDPKVVAKANQKMLALEEIRSILMDNKKRSIYDASLNAGGLGDPDAVARTIAPYMGGFSVKSRRAAGTITNQLERTDAWICTNKKCRTTNPKNTRFCKNCATQIGIDCPNCGMLTELKNPYCTNCGVDIKKAITEKNFMKN